MEDHRIPEYAGLRRELEVGLRLAPSRTSAAPAAKALAAFLDEVPDVPVRLAALSCDGSRVLMTVAVCLGAIDEIKTAEPRSRAAVLLLQRIVDELSSYDPAFVTLPEPSSAEARLAQHLTAPSSPVTLLTAVERLVAVG